jgi:hypothetical protein
MFAWLGITIGRTDAGGELFFSGEATVLLRGSTVSYINSSTKYIILFIADVCITSFYAEPRG